jgi:ariadne-1
MFETNIREGKVSNIKCANGECEKEYSDQVIRQFVTDAALIQKYEKFLKNIEVNFDENKVWCPYPDCDEHIEFVEAITNVECSKGHKFCCLCNDGWHSGACNFEKDKQFLGWVKEKNVKRCPGCQSRTEKNEGCNHMTCRCGFEWCWICQTVWGPDHFGHHFDIMPNNAYVNDDIYGTQRNWGDACLW